MAYGLHTLNERYYMTTHVTHVTVRDDGPPTQPQRIGAIYGIPGPEFKTYVPDYAPNKDALDEAEEDSEVETKVVTASRRPARPKTTATAETKPRGRPRRTRVTDDEGAKEE
jgi:hypothetical protein